MESRKLSEGCAVPFVERSGAERTVREARVAVQQPQPRPGRSLLDDDAHHFAPEGGEVGLDLPGPRVVAAPSEWDGSM